MSERRPLALAALLGAACLLATAAASCSDPAPPTVRSAVDTARDGRVGAFDTALRAVERAEPYRLFARYNPASCACPEFEVRHHGHWQRVALSGPATVVESLRAALSGKPPATTVIEVVGTPTTATRITVEGGQHFPVFEIEAVGR